MCIGSNHRLNEGIGADVIMSTLICQDNLEEFRDPVSHDLEKFPQPGPRIGFYCEPDSPGVELRAKDFRG